MPRKHGPRWSPRLPLVSFQCWRMETSKWRENLYTSRRKTDCKWIDGAEHGDSTLPRTQSASSRLERFWFGNERAAGRRTNRSLQHLRKSTTVQRDLSMIWLLWLFLYRLSMLRIVAKAITRQSPPNGLLIFAISRSCFLLTQSTLAPLFALVILPSSWYEKIWTSLPMWKTQLPHLFFFFFVSRQILHQMLRISKDAIPADCAKLKQFYHHMETSPAGARYLKLPLVQYLSIEKTAAED